MNQLEKAKKKYEEIEVSDKLESVVEKSIKSAYLKNQENEKKKGGHKKAYIWALGMAASFLIICIFTVNVNTSFAAKLHNIPVIGELVKLVSIQSYQEKTEDLYISVDVPSLKQIGEKQSDFPKAINRKISEVCNNYVKEAKNRAIEYKQAFMETGGTLEEWKDHNIKISVGYKIKNENDNYISFEVSCIENWISSEAIIKYYNLDLKNMKIITLKDMIGDDYINIINDKINEQIESQSKNKDVVFFSEKEGGFKSIDANQAFYINADGNIVIVFEKYTIAPGFMGNVEFEIKE